jgi:hypothetical protein
MPLPDQGIDDDPVAVESYFQRTFGLVFQEGQSDEKEHRSRAGRASYEPAERGQEQQIPVTDLLPAFSPDDRFSSQPCQDERSD